MAELKTGGERSASPIAVEDLEPGLVAVRLAVPKGNVLDTAMVTALVGFFGSLQERPEVKAVLLEGQGPHFSFGASVEEHLPDRVAGMLRTFHGLFRAIAGAAVPVLAVVRGQCLGGGLELAAYCHRIFAAPDARLGQPEIKLGVIAPVGSLLLSERMGRGAAEDLLLSGRSLTAEEAFSAGLVDQVAEDPAAAARDWAREHLLSSSGVSLRFAVRASRGAFDVHFFAELDRLESLYLDELVATQDGNEGIRAFLEKRKPEWRNA
jgi:cyclohexa-1,5-dienecarbonyl-CoA hydratase